MALLLPLYGIEEIAQKTLNEVSSVSTEYSAPSAAINDASSSSIIYKVTTSIGKSKDGYFALPAKRFGSSTKIKIGDGEINVIKDLDPIMPNLGRFVQIKEDLDNASDKNEKVDAFKKSDIEMMINCLSNSTIISTLYKPVIGMLESNQGNEIIKRYNFDFEKLMDKKVYQMMVGCYKEEYADILRDVDGARITAWWTRAADITPANGNKGVGVRKILDYYHLDKENAIAFGDGTNDIEMLEAVGTGVAMGNATDDVKTVADAICGHVAEDGIYHYCKEQGLI